MGCFLLSDCKLAEHPGLAAALLLPAAFVGPLSALMIPIRHEHLVYHHQLWATTQNFSSRTKLNKNHLENVQCTARQ
jgi:hypothetical protein